MLEGGWVKMAVSLFDGVDKILECIIQGVFLAVGVWDFPTGNLNF